MSSAQIVVIGAGPGGYSAAFRLADLGLSVTLIDKDQAMGGVCLKRGCIPSKALLHAGRTIHEADAAKNIGIEFQKPVIDIEKLRSWKEGVVSKLTGGLGQLAKARKITCVQGEARFINATTLEIKKPDGTLETLTFEKAIIATGSSPVTLPFLPASERIWDSTKALELPFVPPTMLVIGGGYIGLELGSAYAALGCQVSLVEALPVLLSSADKDLADILLRKLKRNFTNIMTGSKVLNATATEQHITVTLQNAQEKETTATFDTVLVSVGRTPNTKTLGLENTKIELTDKGFIEVTDQCRTDEKNIFAIGDVTAGPLLAHKASAQGKVVAEVIAGHNKAYEPVCIPAVIYTDPELAWCGITEQEARAQNMDVTVFKFPWAASGRALTLDRTDGITKIIADTLSGRILGCGIVGVGAGELISEGVLAIENGLKASDIEAAIHPHPTLSETWMETAEGLFGHPTHVLKIKK